MTQLVLILVIACALLMVVVLLLRDALRGRSMEGQTGTSAGPLPLRAEIPSRALMERIFAEDDLSFVAAERAAGVRREFLRERRRIAISWLGQARREATRILQYHLHAVRRNLDLHPAVEAKLVFHVFLFFAVYSLLRVLVTFYGAFWARSFIKNVVTLAGRLAGLGGSIVADTGTFNLSVAESRGNV
jgi:hypothetical protein